MSHGIVPVEYKVLIRPDPVSEKAGSLYKPASTIEKEQAAQVSGTIVAISPLAFNYEKWPEGARKPEIGDHVYYARYAGGNVKGDDGVEYRLVNDKDIGAIICAVRSSKRKVA